VQRWDDANLESLMVAGTTACGGKRSGQRAGDYTHRRISGVVQLRSKLSRATAGQVDANVLAKRVKRGDVGTVVATMDHGHGLGGSTSGRLALRQMHGFRVHADAAYGGLFRAHGKS